MERVQTLINKLQEQFNKKVSTELLLATTEHLMAELNSSSTTHQVGKVSIVMPYIQTQKHNHTITTVNNLQVVKDEPIEKVVYELVYEDEIEQVDDFIPTLDLQEQKLQIEINDLINDDKKSFNDLLKENKIEVASQLTETPIKDLRKAIGINDKYVFINELFKGNESLYENSIKTINNLSVFPEADQWIKSELITQQQWNTQSDIVKHFNHLVRRRFA